MIVEPPNKTREEEGSGLQLHSCHNRQQQQLHVFSMESYRGRQLARDACHAQQVSSTVVDVPKENHLFMQHACSSRLDAFTVGAYLKRHPCSHDGRMCAGPQAIVEETHMSGEESQFVLDDQQSSSSGLTFVVPCVRTFSADAYLQRHRNTPDDAPAVDVSQLLSELQSSSSPPPPTPRRRGVVLGEPLPLDMTRRVMRSMDATDDGGLAAGDVEALACLFPVLHNGVRYATAPDFLQHFRSEEHLLCDDLPLWPLVAPPPRGPPPEGDTSTDLRRTPNLLPELCVDDQEEMDWFEYLFQIIQASELDGALGDDDMVEPWRSYWAAVVLTKMVMAHASKEHMEDGEWSSLATVARLVAIALRQDLRRLQRPAGGSSAASTAPCPAWLGPLVMSAATAITCRSRRMEWERARTAALFMGEGHLPTNQDVLESGSSRSPSRELAPSACDSAAPDTSSAAAGGADANMEDAAGSQQEGSPAMSEDDVATTSPICGLVLTLLLASEWPAKE